MSDERCYCGKHSVGGIDRVSEPEIFGQQFPNLRYHMETKHQVQQ